VIGTMINIATVLVGGTLGLTFGPRLKARFRETVIMALGLFTLAIGINMFIGSLGVEGENPLVPLVSLLLGGLMGEWCRIEDRLKSLGSWLEVKLTRGGEPAEGSRFIRGFLSASLLFCVGPMTILGSIQDGLTGDYQLLAIKSVLDGFAALALASTLGIGVLFSTLVVLTYQGGISLLAAQAQTFLDEVMMAEISAVGGVLLLGLAIGTLLELRPVRAGNLLPALIVAPLLVFVIRFFGIG
jgi:uncharacterized membrane protein YqgA involved in biofilm formation